jgi:phage tail-like protein
MTAIPNLAAGAPAPSRTPLGPEPVGAMCFTVSAPGVSIGRFFQCSGLGVEYQVLEYHEGGQNAFAHKLRGPLKYRNLVLKQGTTSDDGLLRWFLEAQDLSTRPTITVTLKGPDGKTVRSWGFERAFPVRWSGPVLNASTSELAGEELEIAHRGLVPVGRTG